jgi:outer membrane protein insertion porin family
MPRFPSVRALIALFIAIVCLSWRTTALAQDAGAAANRNVAPFSADAGALRNNAQPQTATQGDAGATNRAAPGMQDDGGAASRAPGAAKPRAPVGDAGNAGNADGGATGADGGSVDDFGEPTSDALRTPAGEEVIPRPLTLPPSEVELARNQSIARIDIVGSRRVSKDDFLTYLREHVGQPFTPEGLTRDVRELWDSGFFDDVQVEIDRRDEGVTLRFVVRERPNIKEITFEGNEEIDAEKLQEGIEAKPNTILSYPSLRRSVQKIRDLYAEKGYFLAEATFDVTSRKDNEVNVLFKVIEHQAVTVRRVTFIGNDHLSDSELRDVMFTGAGGILAFGSGGPFRQDAFERDVLMINATYYDRGFLSVAIAAPRVMLTPDRNGIEIALTINEGPQYKIRQLKIYERDASGREVEPIQGRRHLREMIHAKSGDIFNRAELAKDLQTVRTMYRDEGYANVQADPQTQLDPDKKEVDIVVPIRRGPPVFFDRIEIRGNTKTRDKVIRREMQIAEGVLFSESKLETSKRLITALGFFERVDVSTEEGSAPDRININIEVAEKSTGTFQVGAGFSSVENFILTAQVQQANFFGNGQSVSLQAQVSSLRQSVNIRYFEPYFLDTKFSMATDLYDQLRVYPDFSQHTRGGSITFGHPLTMPPYLRASLSYTAEYDEVSTATTTTLFGTSTAVSIFQRLPLRNLFTSGFTSSLRPALTYDTRDNRLFATSGIYLQGSAELASPVFGSQNQFLRYRAIGSFYYPIGLGFVLKVNTNLGVVTSPLDAGVPIFARFFLGGILDLRGFRLRTIGPRLPLTQSLDPNSQPIPNGAPIGGNLSYYQNVETEFPIIEKVGIRGVVFTDLGNAWNLEQVYCSAAKGAANPTTDPCFHGFDSLIQMRASWGFGIRWFSPLGPLRFEWGFPFNPLPFEEHSVFEFTIGNFF